MRRARPLSTLPGPHSRNVPMPVAAIACTDADQRTGDTSCRSRLARMVAASVVAAALKFCTTGTVGSRSRTSSSNAARLSLAGAIKAQWEGTLTSSGTARRAPASRQAAAAASTAAAAPAITTWPGEL